MLFNRRLRLFWWNEIKLQGKSKENYGDLLGKYLVEKISNKKVIWTKPSEFSILDVFQPIYVTIGSVLANVNQKCIVWGSGIISKEEKVKNAKFIAVRGPQTRRVLMDQNYKVAEVYGDPALLLPRYFNPKIEKSYSLGVIPHYQDYKTVSQKLHTEKDILLIDLMTTSVEETTKEILKCQSIISSSLHGVIIAHAYGIPAVWQPFSDKLYGDGIKFQDYFESVGIRPYCPMILERFDLPKLKTVFNNKQTLPNATIINTLCDGLMAVCPFKD